MKSVWAIARWEFRRFSKARDLIIGALVFAVMFGGGSLFGRFAGEQVAGADRRIAVVGSIAESWGDEVELGRYRLFSATEAAIDSLLETESADAALVEAATDTWEIRARKERGWLAALQAQFGVLLAQERVRALELPADAVQRLMTPATFRTVLVDASDEIDHGKTDAMTAGIALGLMMMGLFSGFGFVFIAITGEKTQRTTESILSAVTPQQWIDGKILGLTGAVLANLLSTAVGYLLWQAVSVSFFDGAWSLPGGAAPLDVLGLAVFSILGFAFWFTLFAMVAATIDDPNSSSRSSLMFLPILLMIPAFLALDLPDVAWMRVMSIVPGPSAAAMPVRMLRGEPAIWEVTLALLLLVAAAWSFRRAAGRIFGTSMLMTGKEPGLREVLRWMRES